MRRILLPLVALGLAVACRKTEQTADPAPVTSSVAADKAASVAPVDTVVDTVALALAPAAVVSADPNIPLNEAVVGAATLPADYTADTAPPSAVLEDQPPRPEADDSWVPGYWWWSRPLHRYVWVSGAWRRPPPEQVWNAGSWTPMGGRYGWTPGYWGPRGYAREMIDYAPPPPLVEERGAPPGAEFVWTPGYYAHRGGSYAWTRGGWNRPPSAGVAWVEPRYVSTGGRYYLQPGRWDVAPERRGTAYQPDINVRPGARATFTVVPPTVVVEHERFATVTAHAVARGATRSATGEFVMPAPVAHVEVREQRGVEAHPETRGVATVREHEHEQQRVEQHVEPHVTEQHDQQHAADPRANERATEHVVRPVENEQHAVGTRETPHVEAREQRGPVVVQPTPTHTPTAAGHDAREHPTERHR